MARQKPYTKKLMVADVILTFISNGGWLIIVIFREFYRHQEPTSS